MEPQRITHVYILGGKKLGFRFADGYEGAVDFTDWDFGFGPMSEPLRENEFFQRARVPEDYPTVQWPNGFDICPDALREWCSEGKAVRAIKAVA